MAKKQNVQDQNAHTLARLLEIASLVRQEGLPEGATRFLADKGIDLASSAVVFVETAGYMLGLEYGLTAFVVTAVPRIWQVESELDASLREVLAVIEFTDVTEAKNLSQHNPGIGWGWGALAVEAMRRLNAA